MLFYQEPYDVVLIEGLVALGTNLASALLIGLPWVFALKKARVPFSIIKREQVNDSSDNLSEK